MAKKYQLIDLPKRVDRQLYEDVIGKVVSDLDKSQHIVAVFGFGNTGHPGISDIDLTAVFDGHPGRFPNPLDSLDKHEKYLFTHNITGIPVKLVESYAEFTVDQGAKLISGQPFRLFENNRDSAELESLNRQFAFEFLIKYVVDMTIQHELGILKVRPLLQSFKAAKYSLELLNVNDDSFVEWANRGREFVDEWFENKNSSPEIGDFFIGYRQQLIEFVQTKLDRLDFFVPGNAKFDYSRNVVVERGDKITYSRSGLKLPRFVGKLGKRWLNLQNRMNSFGFTFPLREFKSDFLLKRMEFLRELQLSVAEFGDCFSAPMPPLFSYSLGQS